jgi:glycerophosphoryl diester phosphodiesterase
VSIDVELKETGYEEEVIATVLSLFDPGHVMFKSFHESSVKKLTSYEPPLFAGLLLGYKLDLSKGSVLKKKISPLARVLRTGARFVSPHWRLIRRGFISRMHGAGLPVFAWTVNDLRVARRLIRQEIDGLITDVPDRLARLL